MSTLETQYKTHLRKYPESKITFEEFRILLAKQIESAFEKFNNLKK